MPRGCFVLVVLYGIISLQENRNILAVPGPIDSELSAGCNELIEIDARPVMNANDILEELSNHFYTVPE